VAEFRSQVLAPFFANYAKQHGKYLDQTTFYNKLQSLQAMQQASYLKGLEPANALPIWSVTVNTEDSVQQQ